MTFLVGVDAFLFCLVLQHFFLADGKAVRSKQNPFNISVVIVLPKNMGRKPMVPRGGHLDVDGRIVDNTR